MLDMLASSNTWLAPATAYCREATRETVNQFAQGPGATIARVTPGDMFFGANRDHSRILTHIHACAVDCRNAYKLYAHR